MKRVRVIAPMGATVSGDAKVLLTPDQHSRRAAILGPATRTGIYAIPGGAGIMLKHGEEFGIDSPERLNKALFEEIEPAQKKAAKAKPEKAKPEKAKPEPEPSGDGDGDGSTDPGADDQA